MNLAEARELALTGDRIEAANYELSEALWSALDSFVNISGKVVKA